MAQGVLAQPTYDEAHGLKRKKLKTSPAGPTTCMEEKAQIIRKVPQSKSFSFSFQDPTRDSDPIGPVQNCTHQLVPSMEKFVIAGTTPAPVLAGSTPVTLAQAPPPPRVAGPVTDPPRRSTSSDTSTEELSPALLGAIQQIVATALREHVSATAPPRVATPSDVEAPEEEAGEEAPMPVPPAGRRREIPLPEPQEVPPQWLAHLEHLQKCLQDVRYQIEGAPEDERQGVPFTEAVMVDELPMNYRTPTIAEYDGTTDPMEHLSGFENAALLHRYTDGIKCRVGAFARATQQWFNQLPVGAIESFQEFRSLFLHQFASSRKLHKTELSLFVIRQRVDEPLKEYLQRFNAAALEVPSTTQEVKASAFSQGLSDGDFFKSLTKKSASEFDALLARAAKFINIEDAQAAKKEIRGEKQKEVKEEAPSKKPRIDTPDKKPPFQRVNTVLTPLTVPSHKLSWLSRKKEVLDHISKEKGIRQKRPRPPVLNDPSGKRPSKHQEVREAHDIFLREVLDVEAMEDTPLIQFGMAVRSGPRTSHNDALVITATLANYEEKWLHPRGMVSLPLTMGTGTTRRTCLLKFLVVDVPSAYNVILGRPTLNAFQAVISTYHMKIKFPTQGGVGEAQGNHLQSRKCYVEAVRKGQKRNSDEVHKGVSPSKKGKEAVAEGTQKRWRHQQNFNLQKNC
ncbi:UNVERIFIED_CONTAM: hypothetical protein Slati_0191700 [Sesamum latifolium]|uniref:Retrotransposon gag domain-containing protein n=1 Tax=Sesamum latifolium TaxID=2727402 RepID=A0AAW2YBM6_9LAMI